MVSPAFTATPDKVKLPLPGSVVIFTALNRSPSKASLKPNSAVVKAWAVSSKVMTVLFVPLGASLTALISTVIVYAKALSSAPSLTLNSKVSYVVPLALEIGTNFRFPAIISATAITWLRVTSAPFSCKLPTVSNVVILTLAKVAPASTSEKLKSAAVNVYVVSSLVATVLFAAVGASFISLMLTVMVPVVLLVLCVAVTVKL